MLRTLLTASLALLLAVQTSCQDLVRTPGRPAEPLTRRQVWMLDTTYTDRQHGVSFRYPSTWRATTQFSYIPPALTRSKPMSIAAFGYNEGGFPRDRIVGPYASTNLEGVGIVYSSVPAASAAECRAMAASLSHSRTYTQVVFGHRSFSVYETGEAAMSKSIKGTLYAAYVRPTCYLFETDIAAVSTGALVGIQELTTAECRYIDTHLLDIMKSVQIVPSPRKSNVP